MSSLCPGTDLLVPKRREAFFSALKKYGGSVPTLSRIPSLFVYACPLRGTGLQGQGR